MILSTTSIYAEDSKEGYLESFLNNTKEYREMIHKSVVDVSSNIDSYFIPEKLQEANYDSSYALLELSSYYNEGEGLSFDQRIKIKLKLPKLKEKVNLEIETDEKRESTNFAEDHKSNEDANVNVGLAYYKILKNHINIKSKIGIKVKSELDPFFRIEAKKTWHHTNSFESTLSQTFKQSVTKKTESTSYYRLDKKLDDIFSIHNYNEHYWESSREAYNQVYTSFYLNQLLSDKRQLTYTFGTNIDNISDIDGEKSNLKPKRYSLSVKYRQYIKDWFYFDIIPENYYKEEKNFTDDYAIRFNLGMYFNKNSY